jgi:nucleotide-binding universal stress UspA family protein
MCAGAPKHRGHKHIYLTIFCVCPHAGGQQKGIFMGNIEAGKAARAGAKKSLEKGAGFKRILVPLDFSKTSVEALQYAKDFAHKFGATVVLVHVVEKPPFMAGVETNPLVLSEKEIIERAKAELQLLASRELDEDITVETLVRKGKPFNEINEAAKVLKADLIIISTHGYTGLKHTFLGSTAERVIRHAPCGVLVVRKS